MSNGAMCYFTNDRLLSIIAYVGPRQRLSQVLDTVHCDLIATQLEFFWAGDAFQVL